MKETVLLLVERNHCQLIADRHGVADALLDEVCEQEYSQTTELVSGSYATVAIDGWSNINNDPVTGVSMTTEDKIYLVDAIKPHNSDYMFEIAKDVIDTIEQQYGVNVSSVVSDSAANMVGIRKQTDKEKKGILLRMSTSAVKI